MGDRGAKGALGLGALDVNVDPLVVAGEVGKGVDVLLGDRAPLARADLLPDQSPHALDTLYLDACHRRQSNRSASVGQGWLKSSHVCVKRSKCD